MHEPLIDGVIRKIWIDRIGPYRDHLLRLDTQSRRNRFGGAVSDEFIENYIELSVGLDAVSKNRKELFIAQPAILILENQHI